MKGLLKYISPFAPDQSGASSVLYDLGGVTVICDAGGCTGNICGFDEPRWVAKKSAIFSAGLRDMDAILGRDDRLVEKLQDVIKRTGAPFATIIGTPVPAVIATDYRALARMAKKRCGVPVLTVECTGTRLYDEGASDAYRALFREFAEDAGGFCGSDKGTPPGHERSAGGNKGPAGENKASAGGIRAGTLGILGATPLDLSDVRADQRLRAYYRQHGGFTAYCYGMGDGLDAVRLAGTVEKNIVVAPAGLLAAKDLNERFGTPYETAYPLLRPECKEALHALAGKKTLVVHQQIAANAIRNEIRRGAQDGEPDVMDTVGRQAAFGVTAARGRSDEPDVTAATWFMQYPEEKEPQDLVLKNEAQFRELVLTGHYDAIVGDRILRRAIREFDGTFIHIPHFAVSGECEK